jgi:GTP-sensing pleiotropic transcriptional regulator CodY
MLTKQLRSYLFLVVADFMGQVADDVGVARMVAVSAVHALHALGLVGVAVPAGMRWLHWASNKQHG